MELSHRVRAFSERRRKDVETAVTASEPLEGKVLRAVAG